MIEQIEIYLDDKMSASKSKWKRHNVGESLEAVNATLCVGEGCKRFRRKDKV